MRLTKNQFLAALLTLAAGQAAAQQPAFDAKAHYSKRDYMVPMRDGVKLFTIVYAPRDTTRIYPVI
ncbi:MAG: CocE/NonD family hydrolase, partial [Longimicrobiales bacterium]